MPRMEEVEMQDIKHNTLSKIVTTLTPDQRLRACAEAQLDLRTLRRIRTNRPVRHSSTARLARALRRLGYLETSMA
jgi:hypothetical protein